MGIDIIQEELPQGVGLFGSHFFNHGSDALFALVDDVLDVFFLLVALDHGQHGAGEHFLQVPQCELRCLLRCLGQTGLAAAHLKHPFELPHVTPHLVPGLACNHGSDAWCGIDDACPPLFAQLWVGCRGCEPSCLHAQRVALLVQRAHAQGKWVAYQ